GHDERHNRIVVVKWLLSLPGNHNEVLHIQHNRPNLYQFQVDDRQVVSPAYRINGPAYYFAPALCFRLNHNKVQTNTSYAHDPGITQISHFPDRSELQYSFGCQHGYFFLANAHL